MIKIPSGLISKYEIINALDKDEEYINAEVKGITFSRRTGEFIVEIKTNFDMPEEISEKIRANFIKECKKNAPEGWSGDAEIVAVCEKERSSREKLSETALSRKAMKKKLFGVGISGGPVPYSEMENYISKRKKCVLEGVIFKLDSRTIRYGVTLFTILISDKGKAACVKVYAEGRDEKVLTENLRIGMKIAAIGSVEEDRFENEIVLRADGISKLPKTFKRDTYKRGKRVELHAHTKMSENDGLTDVEDLVTMSAHWGQPAVAITDHGVVQSFPDAAATAERLKKEGINIKIIYGMEGYLYPDEDAIGEDGKIDIKKHGTHHIILLAKNETGLRNLYKLVSLSHINYFYYKPRLPRSVIEAHREGLLIGSACEAGEMYRAVKSGKSDEELMKIADFYDYLEIQPLGNNRFMIDKGEVESNDDLIANNLKILEIADRLGKMTVATTDSHYPTQDAGIFRRVIMSAKNLTETNSDCLYLRTTNEMMDEFSYLGDRAEEIVVTNTNKIADMVSEIKPVPEGKFPPQIDNADKILREEAYKTAKDLYGDTIPEMIKSRLDEELNAIIGNGYAVLYVAARLLVQKSLSAGYIVGSRGSVGSSLAATMAGITEVNPLPPHYVCPKCKHLEMCDDGEYDCGWDMPEKICPECGEKMNKDGFDISFATFLGFKGDKEPDIDLNFAGEYQTRAHKYVGEIFGEENIFKAGTVSTLAEKKAYGYVKNYIEKYKQDHRDAKFSKYDVEYMIQGCLGLKSTTGQHPGGIIILPDKHEITEFCPVQRPANKSNVDIITTHFDYHKIDKNLLKLDLLGHDVPSMLKHLKDSTGIDPLTVNIGDSKVLSIFTSTDALDIKVNGYKFKHGTYGIPEFGTGFVRNMLDTVQPKTVSQLIKISGFSHGTGVWRKNAEDLLKNGTATIDEVISCRDDIMNYLIKKGIDKSGAFKIMEKIRKNKPLNEKELALMRSHSVPEWYIESCDTLEYLFPRAHAAAYVMMAGRMAWYKVYYPKEFYAALLTAKRDSFNSDVVRNGYAGIQKRMTELGGKDLSGAESDEFTIDEILYEMYSRGFSLSYPQLGVSSATDFKVIDGEINMPFSAVKGVGSLAAESLIKAQEEGGFISLDDVRRKTKLTSTNIDSLNEFGVFGDMRASAQISMFDI